jgi:ribose-phosphate pyrophosphokinase
MTARAVARALNPFLKEGQVHLVNIHAPSILGHFCCPANNLDATPLLAEKVATLGLKDPVVISPDKGAVAMARTAAAALGADSDYLQKTRLSGTEVRMAPKEIDVRDRDVVIFDDMIATGGTMATAIEMLRAQGAARVYLAAVHPVLTGSAVLKLYRSGVEGVLATDTLDKGVSTVSVAPIIARALES